MDILIVEDNTEISTLMADFLRKEGYMVATAPSGEKGLELYFKYGARLVLLDIMLPGLDGFSVCSKIREDSNTPIMILSAKSDKEDKLNGLILGADDYIDKPYDVDILLAKTSPTAFVFTYFACSSHGERISRSLSSLSFGIRFGLTL